MAEASTTTAAEGGLRYLISLPMASPPPGTGGGPVPVLCFLHGQGEASPMPPEQAAALRGPLSATSWAPARRRFIIVEPQRPGLGDDWFAESDAVTSIVRRAWQSHGGDPARTYLTGFSLGGNGVLDFAAKGPDLWAAFWVVDPTRLPARVPRRPMRVSAGPLTKWNRGYEAMRDAGGGIRVTDEADDHVEADARAYGRAEVYDWLLEHRLLHRGPSS